MGEVGTITRAAPTQPRPHEPVTAHLGAIVGASQDALVSVSLDGTIVVWNAAAEALYGYSAAEAVGRPVSLILPSNRSYDLKGLIKRISSGERTDPVETVLVRKDGRRIDVSVSAFPVEGASGELIGVAAVTRDITERKSVEGELQQWRDQLQAIVQGVDDAVLVRGPGGRMVYANENAARLLGFPSSGALIANPIADTYRRFTFYTQDGDYVPGDKLPGMLALQGTDVPPTVMRFSLLHTGEERWAIVKSVPIRDEQGNVQYAASIFTDITERRRAEEALRASETKFQAFMDNSPLVAFIKDEEARFVYVNPQFERAFATTAEAVVGVSDTQVVPDDVAQRIHEDDAEVLTTGRLKQILEVIPAPDGTPHHWLTFKFPLSLGGGQRFIAGASVDISERVQAQEALERYAARLQALSRQLIEAQEAERRRIARDLHDQIGQSLTAIKIDLQVAQHQAVAAMEGRPAGVQSRDREGGSEDVSPHVIFTERLGKSIEMVERTIQQVRAFALDLRPSILDDLGLPSALLWYADEQARRVGFTTNLAVEQLPARLSPELEITCFRIAQEAITNVVRHARAGRVWLELRRCGRELVLTIRDDGVGFDPRALAGTTHAEAGGDSAARQGAHSLNRIKTLGLTGMNERVSLVGGSLSIESAPGMGTAVKATFPLDAPLPKSEGALE